MQSPGRFEARLRSSNVKVIQQSVVNNPLLIPFVERVLGTNRFEIDTFSTVTSMPKTPAQHWHRDVGPVFDSVPASQTLRPQAVVMFVSLINVTEEMGPTQFIAGSHHDCFKSEKRNLRYGGWNIQDWCVLLLCYRTRVPLAVSRNHLSAACSRPSLFSSSLLFSSCLASHSILRRYSPHVGNIISTPGKIGTAVLFDSRIRHRGGSNQGDIIRPLLYMSYAQEWYYDSVNFNNKQTKSFDSHGPWMKKLLTRLDTFEYITELEKRAKEAGVDTVGLQSGYNYNKYNFLPGRPQTINIEYEVKP